MTSRRLELLPDLHQLEKALKEVRLFHMSVHVGLVYAGDEIGWVLDTPHSSRNDVYGHEVLPPKFLTKGTGYRCRAAAKRLLAAASLSCVAEQHWRVGEDGLARKQSKLSG
jgi:hypothetical protein